MRRKSKPPPGEPMVTAPALVEWRDREAKWKREGLDWVRSRLEEHFTTEAAFQPMTAGELLRNLDADASMPTGWARLVKSDTASYRERYGHVRNTLEVMARQKHCIMATTLNAKGKDATTYARPRDATADWAIAIEGDRQAIARARQGINDWLSLDGSVLDGIQSLTFTRRGAEATKGVTQYGGSQTSESRAGHSRPRPRAHGRGAPRAD